MGIAKKRVLSEDERARLAAIGHRFGKRSDSRGAQTGEKPASRDVAATPVAERGEDTASDG